MSSKIKSPIITKVVGIIEIILGTAFILFTIPSLFERDNILGVFIFLAGLLFLFTGIFYFRFSKAAWFINLFLLSIFILLLVSLLKITIEEYGEFTMDSEIIFILPLIFTCLILLVLVILGKKHLKKTPTLV